MAWLYLNSYRPLVATPSGRQSSERFGIPPFVDGSIRREPDLEHRYPSITCLCRGEQFAPRLVPGDHVAYMTCKARYGSPRSHRRVTAILRVHALLESHDDAATWYMARGLPLPSNCMVLWNQPLDVSRSHRQNRHAQGDDARWTSRWDEDYRHRARRNGRFVVCEPLWRDLGWDAPVVHDSDLEAAFGRVPGTRNPGRLPLTQLPVLAARLRVPLTLSSP